MGPRMQIPPPKSSKGYWDVAGHHWKSKNPHPNIGAEYVLSDGPVFKGLTMELRYSGQGSPFTYNGTVQPWLVEPRPQSEDASQFKIEGEGIIVDESDNTERESTFKIVAGSGKGLYSGISGGGKLIVTIRIRSPKVYGNCVFRNMNNVGASLM
ncbi:MAG: hypothetical protein L6R42_004044 [Xanthoria sp. 1 TBL-2021]|nr:MAG: hypothetical protein L6R42_004044 [Xanthoria sp. 1 TBL-2021]